MKKGDRGRITHHKHAHLEPCRDLSLPPEPSRSEHAILRRLCHRLTNCHMNIVLGMVEETHSNSTVRIRNTSPCGSELLARQLTFWCNSSMCAIPKRDGSPTSWDHYFGACRHLGGLSCKQFIADQPCAQALGDLCHIIWRHGAG